MHAIDEFLRTSILNKQVPVSRSKKELNMVLKHYLRSSLATTDSQGKYSVYFKVFRHKELTICYKKNLFRFNGSYTKQSAIPLTL